MAYVLDGIAAVLILGLGIVGAVRGFFKTVMQVIAVIVALALASQFATPLAEKIYGGLFESDLERAMQIQMADFEGNAIESINKLLEVMPEKPKQMMEKYGLFTADDCLKKAEISTRENGQKAVDGVVNKVVRPTMVNTLTGGCFLVLFVVLLAAALLVVVLLNRTMSLPGLNAVNRVLGFLVGALEGGVCVLLLANVLSLSASSAAATKKENPKVDKATIESTYILRHFELKDNVFLENVRDWATSTAKAKAAQKNVENKT